MSPPLSSPQTRPTDSPWGIKRIEDPGLPLEFKAEGLVTNLGGVFYLINILKYLDLPQCFEADWHLATQVGAWGVLEVLGRALIGEAGLPLAADPLWRVLAEMAGRQPGKLPGMTFQGCDHFHLPPAWLTGSRDQVFHWGTSDQRFRLWSARGYLLMAGSDEQSPPATRAWEELGNYPVDRRRVRLTLLPFSAAPLDPLTSPLLAGLNLNLARWLTQVLPFIRLRLQDALKVDGAGLLNLETAVLLHPGRLFLTSTHIDLVMSLEDISLPLRLAGLDHDPGWVADLARIIQFHFV